MKSDQAQATICSAIDALAAQLETDSQALTTFLAAMSRFHKYSYVNVMLILSQEPEATRVAGFPMWQSFKRHVKT